MRQKCLEPRCNKTKTVRQNYEACSDQKRASITSRKSLSEVMKEYGNCMNQNHIVAHHRRRLQVPRSGRHVMLHAHTDV